MSFFALLFLIHGALWLAIETEGDLHKRSVSTANTLWPVLLGVAVVFLIASRFSTRLYDNYVEHPAFFIVILIFKDKVKTDDLSYEEAY